MTEHERATKIWHRETVLRWATYGLVLLLPLSVFRPVGELVTEEVFYRYVTAGFYLADALIFLILVVGVATGMYRRSGSLAFAGALLGLGLLGLLSVPGAISPALAGYTTVRWLLVLNVYLWFVQPAVPLRRIVAVFVAGLCVQAIIGLAQVVVQGPLGLPGELALPPAVSFASIVEVDGTRWLRAYGLAFHPNVLGGFLAVGIVLGIPLLRTRPGRGAWWLLWLGLFLTFSRSAWIGVALVVPVVAAWLWWSRPGERQALAWALAGAALVLLLSGVVWRGQLETRLQPLLQRLPLAQETDTQKGTPRTEAFSLSERAELARAARSVVARRPWRGVGAGNFPLTVIPSGVRAVPQPVHNVFLLLAAETGVVGGALWAFLWLVAAVHWGREWRRDNVWAVVALGAGLALAVVSLVDFYPWGLNSGRLLTAMVLGLAGHALSDREG